MLGKFFKKALKRDESASCSIETHRLLKMNMTELHSYVNNKIPDLQVDLSGLDDIMNKLITPIGDTKKFCLRTDDSASKKKKCFDIVMTIIAHKDINIRILEKVQKFSFIYEDLLKNFDEEYNQKYFKAIENSTIESLSRLGELSKEKV